MNIDDPERHVATIGEHRVLFVMATEHEYGPHLKKRIDPVITGVGPVEAATSTAATLAVLAHRGTLPDLVFTLGSAGSRKLEHAEIYQVTSVAYRDMDCSALGFERGLTPFLDEPAVISIPHEIPGIPSATLSSGGSIVSGAAYDAIASDMVDMETYAVLRGARRFRVPLVGLRGITDGRAALAGFHDWADYLHIVDEKLAAALDHFAEHVRSGRWQIAGKVG